MPSVFEEGTITVDWFKDTFERVAATYVEAFLAILIAAWASGDTFDPGIFQTAGLAAIPASLAVLKSAVATFTGDPDSAAIGR